MIKSAKFISLFFLFTGCTPNLDILEGEYVFNDPYFFGIIDRDVLKNHQNYKWFNKQYSQYNPNIEKLSKTKIDSNQLLNTLNDFRDKILFK